MITVERSIAVRRPQSAVFDILAEMDRYPDFFVGITRWESLGSVRHGVGDRFRVLMSVGSIEAGGTVRVTAWTDQRTIAWTGETGIRQQGSWLLRPAAQGTEVTVRLGFDLAGPLGGIVERIASITIGRKLDATLSALRHLTEYPTDRTARELPASG